MPFNIKTFDGRYIDVAQRIAELSKTHMVFTTKGTTGLEDLIDLLDDESRQIMNCHCCRAALRKLANLVYLDAEFKPRALFWRSLETDNIDLNQALDAIAAKIEKPRLLVAPYATQKYVAMKPGEFRKERPFSRVVGVANKGGFDHFHAVVGIDKTCTRNYTQISGTLQNLIIKYNALDLIAAIKLCILKAEGIAQFPAGHLEDLRNILKVFTIIHDHCPGSFNLPAGINAAFAMTYDAADGQAFNSALDIIHHWNSAAIGDLIDKVAADSQQLDWAFDIYFKQIDPHKFRVVKSNEVKAAAVKAAQEVIVNGGYLPSLMLKVAGPEDDVSMLWKPIVVKASEEQKLDMFEQALAKMEAPAEPTKPVLKDVIKITMDKFIQTVLPTAQKMFYTFNEYYEWLGTVAIPNTLNTKAILEWDTPENPRREVLMTSPERSSIANYGFHINQRIELAGFGTTPYTTAEGVSVVKQAAPGWLFYFTTDTRSVNPTKVRSIANMCKAEFYPHRAAIDHVVSQQEIPYGDETLVTIGLGSGGTRVVQVEDGDAVRTYEVFAI